MENQVLNKLVDSFDDFKERLIRIEVQLQGVNDIKTDVNNLKIEVDKLKTQLTQVVESAKSAHKRADTSENNQTWLWRAFIGAVIVGAVGWVFATLKGGV